MSEVDGLTLLNDRVDALLQNLSPQERKALTRNIARHLRGTQAKRIRENIGPDGSPFSPRKPQVEKKTKGRSRRGSLRMFKKIHRTSFMRAGSTPASADVSFSGLASRIAREHQYGLRARVNKKTTVKMEQRELLGFSQEEMKTVEEMMILHLAAR